MRWISHALSGRKFAGSWVPYASPATVKHSVRLVKTAPSNRSKRRLVRQLGLDGAELGVTAPWYSHFLPKARGNSWIWVLHKNSSVPKRVRAVAANAEQRTSLNALNRTSANSAHFTWSRFELQGRKGGRHGQTPCEVHALVRTRQEYAQPNADIKVRVDSVFEDRDTADRALNEMTAKFPTNTWAVITYPVGEMLF